MNKDARTKAVTSRGPSTPAARPPSSSRSAKAAAASARRTWVVLATLAGGLAGTGALLKALAPPPLTPDATASLFAVGQEQSISQVLDAPIAVTPGRWHSIYIHQSLTSAGNASSLGTGTGGLPDHFLVGNGNPLADGAIQTGQRWIQQMHAGRIPGVDEISSDCVSICIVGNFNRDQPSAAQQARLAELVAALQHQLGISSDQVFFGAVSAQSSSAGLGTRFPIELLRSQVQ